MPYKTGSRVREYGYNTQKHARNEHKQDWRGRLSEMYNTRHWRKESLAFRQSHPFCAECMKQGRIRGSEVTDHIIPYPLHDFWDMHNWQALCKSCNNAKGEKDKKLLNDNKIGYGG